MSAKKIFVWCDADLDGAVSYLVLSWYFKQRIPTRCVSIKNFAQEFTAWAKYTDLDEYDKIFVIDLDVPNTGILDMVDRDNVVVIDHHKSHINRSDEYKAATTILKLYTSCCKLVYDTFKSKLELTQSQLLMVLLGDDYDAYALDIPGSYELNILYWSLQGDRVTKFYERYKDGFSAFNNYEKNIISLYKKKFKSIKRHVQPYKCFLHIKDKPVRFIAASADSCINELADHLILKYKSDVGVIINLNTNRFSLRKSKTCDLDLSELINKIGNGGGHEYAAGGVVDSKFLTFSKLLIPAK